MVKRNYKQIQTHCMWCDDKLEKNKYDMFLFFDREGKQSVIFERPICKSCQEIFDTQCDSNIKKKRGVKNGRK